ncbi:hypothetical protein E4634_16070 [Mangrovimicrobium sediminis]|uniref:Uncharacterized protein n=1 Tax=Mangrovimicrobium sediminis TaxID=2562682 RepID=A0A4Z0LXW8_9GAMM|nr:hypothetical protein [Haliea sp. SAOS-164]TGD72182.1 hypothetical protein E4634_16070 [Haliea sp. SAOS-164]
MRQDIGYQFVRELAAFWAITDDRAVWYSDGFDWWPGSHRLSVRVSEGIEIDGNTNFKVTLRTELLESVHSENDQLPSILRVIMNGAPSYTVDHLDSDCRAAMGVGPGERPIALVSTVYIREDNLAWTPRFIAGTGILQAYDAQRLAVAMAEQLGVKPAVSGPNGPPLATVDESLFAIEHHFVPAGQEPSRWAGSGEFEEIAERLPEDQFFVNADKTGLSLELAFGSDTALIELHTSQPHPVLGHGLLTTLKLPFEVDGEYSLEPCFYAQMEVMNDAPLPLLGSWTIWERGESRWVMAYSSFIPNIIHQPNLALNQALWMIGRARWVKDKFFPEMA